MASIDPELPVFNVRTLGEHVETNLVFRSVPVRLFAVVGPLLLALVSIGIYAVVAYAVSLRTAEIGVRLAIGATARRVVAGLVAESLRVAAWGAGVGWVVAFLVAVRLLDGRMMAVSVFAGVPAIILLVAALACWLPARRAARLDPASALREMP